MRLLPLIICFLIFSCSVEEELSTIRNNLSSLDNQTLTYESEKNEINIVISEI